MADLENVKEDVSGLGDWYVNTDKLEGGLKPIADGINAMGMKFGLWFEPECISETVISTVTSGLGDPDPGKTAEQKPYS